MDMKKTIALENKETSDDILLKDRPTEIESYCVRCHEKGLTKLLCTNIPYFGDVILMAFSCPCGFENNEIMPGGSLQKFGVRFTLTEVNLSDLNRQVAKSQYASIQIPELEFEIPPGTGKLSTIEGFLQEAIYGLQYDQPARREKCQEEADKIDIFIEKLKELANGKDFMFILDDPSGNSFIENPHAPNADPKLTLEKYPQTKVQIEAMGYQYELEETHASETDVEDIYELSSLCSNCRANVKINVQRVDIPHFKEVILMAMSCDQCGYRSTEVKAGGIIAEHGIKFILKVASAEDLNRDVIKSSFSTVSVPELQLERATGFGEDKFTTVEGLLEDIRNKLLQENPFIYGDAAPFETKKKLDEFLCNLERLQKGERSFTLTLDDPTGNSYIQSINDPETDSHLRVERYTRTKEQDEDLGLTCMKTEDSYTETD
ncbi:zinc finger protein ZPR1-like [Zophobas morio]|uniref:zinc finger protein ZPR1-like n=1 Tax=Zophobas morio TaxID=2755281 RepID=UPI003083A66C